MHTNRFIAICALFIVLAGSSVGLCADAFHVGPGDILEISIWKDPDLSREVVVPPDNIISFPLIGDFDAKGMSVTQLRKIITTKLSEFIPDASVTVILKQINSLNVYVIGQVHKPGAFSINMEARVMQVLAQAQGLTPFASERDIHIMRYTAGGAQKIGFDYKEVLKGNKLEQDILLKRGDVIVVP